MSAFPSRYRNTPGEAFSFPAEEPMKSEPGSPDFALERENRLKKLQAAIDQWLNRQLAERRREIEEG